MFRSLLLVGLGGAIGSMLRYLISIYFTRFNSVDFPWATFSANILGCFIIGIVLTQSYKNDLIGNDIRLLLAVGFCGGLTTFSSFAVENITLINNKQFLILALYTAVSLLAGLTATWFGMNLVKN